MTSHVQLAELGDVSDSERELEQPSSASRKKMKLDIADDKTSHCSKKEIVTESDEDVAGYRLVQLDNLSSVLSSVHKCEEGQ